MTSVWKRLQRVNKRAAKFQFTASYHRVDLEITPKWKPNKLSVVWSRRSRRVIAEPLEWEPSMKEPLKGSVIWAVPDNHNVAVTLFRDQRTNELEDKDWIFILEDVATSGRRRKIAQVSVNLRPLASAGPSQKCLSLQMRPCTTKVTSASIEVTISSVLLREGSAADEDMQSMASMMSVNNNSDIAPLEDFDEDDISENSASLQQMINLTQQMDLMTSSLTGTPGSATSLSITPIAMTPSDQLLNEISKPAFVKAPSIDDDRKYSHTLDISNMANSTPISKENLKPLDLKINLNDYSYSTDAEEMNSNNATPIVTARDKNSELCLEREEIPIRDATPAHDLLEWCKEATKNYPQCTVANLSSSWIDGIAFCAIIHNFRPDLIDMAEVSPNDPEANLRLALKASDTLGVPTVLHPSELKRARGPDRLALITYLHQLRALFTNRQLRLSKIGQTTEESSYIIGNFDSDRNTDISVEMFSQEILSMRQKKNENNTTTNRASLSSQDSMDSQHSQERISFGTRLLNKFSPDRHNSENSFQKEKSPMENVKDMKDMILASSKSIIGRVLSPTKEKIQNIKDNNSKDVNENNSNKANIINKEMLKNYNKELNKPDVKSDVSSQPCITVRETWPVKLMTRKQLTDPFGSDEEDEQDIITVHVEDKPADDAKLDSQLQNDLSPTFDALSKPSQQLLSRHDELKEKARQLLETARMEARKKHSSDVNPPVSVIDHNGHKTSDDARQALLRARARKLIADARAGLITSPTSPGNKTGTVEVISASNILSKENLTDYYNSEDILEKNDLSKIDANTDSDNNILSKEATDSSYKESSPSSNKSSSPLRSYTNLMDRMSPDKDSFIMKGFGKDMRNYIQSEMEALEREQSAIDKQAAILEKELRAVMESSDKSDEEENELMIRWFTLVNKKNALLRRQMQLNILEQESELRARHAKVDCELRALLKVEEWRKSEGQRGDEARLLRELLTVVEARDQLVHHLHEHEQAIEDDDEIERNLSNVDLKKKNNCFIQ